VRFFPPTPSFFSSTYVSLPCPFSYTLLGEGKIDPRVFCRFDFSPKRKRPHSFFFVASFRRWDFFSFTPPLSLIECVPTPPPLRTDFSLSRLLFFFEIWDGLVFFSTPQHPQYLHFQTSPFLTRRTLFSFSGGLLVLFFRVADFLAPFPFSVMPTLFSGQRFPPPRFFPFSFSPG